MKRNIRLLLIFVTAYATNVVMAKAQFAPETIKQLVETSSDSYCYSTPPLKSTYQVAQDVLADGSLEILFKYYSLEDIFSWNNGKLFFQEIQYYCDSTAKNQLMPYLKEYAQKQLQKIFIADVINLPTPTAFHAHNDYETTAQVASDLNTNQSYKQHIKELAPLLCSIIKEEKELNDKGYIVLFHGQRWEYLFGEKLYTDLWALTHHKKRPTNYLFAHVRMKGHDPVEEYGPQQRFKLLHTGWHYYNFMLWTCNSLFSNYKVADYSSPLSYFLKNDNYGRVTFCLQEIFDYYKLSHLYQKHAKDIAELEKLYNAARTLGTILRVAIPRVMINDYCFHPDHYYKDTLAFIDSLKNSTVMNNKEFCVVMLDKAMDPEGGILIKPYHCAKQSEYQQFEAGYEKLIKKLEAELAIA